MLSETAAAVELVQVSKAFGSSRAVHALNLQVRPGELVALLGPNGAGKTTAISLMLGLRKPTFGTVRLAGHDPCDVRVRGVVGALLQNTGLPGALRVVEVINLFRSFHSAPFSSSALLELTGLEAKARHYVGVLSAGERQRLLFAIAMAGNPYILFLDEPTVFMDIEGRAHFRSLARELVGRGRSIILTTHFPDEAEALADRVVILSQGTVAACGTARHIKQIAGRERLEDAVATLTGQTLGACQ
jgi:ABC-2 type transport system ATP-binding protein